MIQVLNKHRTQITLLINLKIFYIILNTISSQICTYGGTRGSTERIETAMIKILLRITF